MDAWKALDDGQVTENRWRGQEEITCVMCGNLFSWHFNVDVVESCKDSYSSGDGISFLQSRLVTFSKLNIVIASNPIPLMVSPPQCHRILGNLPFTLS